MKRKIAVCIDIAMLILLILLMNYIPGAGLMLHAEMGIAVFVLFIIHHILNLHWYKTLFRGKYTFRRALLTGTDFLLLAAIIATGISAVMISGMVFTFSRIPMDFRWSLIHKAAAAWAFVLTAFHLGLHLHGKLCRMEKGKAAVPMLILELILLALGVWCFGRQEFGMRMLTGNANNFVQSASVVQWLELIGILAGICVLTHIILLLHGRLRERG